MRRQPKKTSINEVGAICKMLCDLLQYRQYNIEPIRKFRGFREFFVLVSTIQVSRCRRILWINDHKGRVKYRSRLRITSNGRFGVGVQPMDVIFSISVAPIDELKITSKKVDVIKLGGWGSKITSIGRYPLP